jgi:chloride channel 3/4/5
MDRIQPWIVVFLVGMLIGASAGSVNIITEWASDIKFGYCSTAWYLNQKYCCWEAWKDGTCDDWYEWSYALSFARDNVMLNFVLFAVVATGMAYVCAVLVKSYAPYAAGSGISEIKAILSGFVIRDFLGFWTLLIKSFGLSLSVGSGLSVGKEGPSVHVACCIGNVVSQLFGKFRRSQGTLL